jgi:hypothetical protein
MSARPRAVRQAIFTIIAKADRSQVGKLGAYLAGINDALTRQSALPFGAIEMLHFCSFTVFHDDSFGPYLVFESNIDGTPNDYIEAICNVAGPALHTIYGFCLDYGSPNLDSAYLRRYLHQHIVCANAAFVGNIGRSARRIRDEASLVAEIQVFLDRFDPPEGTAPETIAAAVREFVRGDGKWSWVWQVPPRLGVYDRASRWAAVVGLAAFVFAGLPLTLLLVAVFLIALRRRETTDSIDIPGPPVTQVQQLTEREDQIAQNHMASLCYVKPGAFRRRTLKFVLFVANLVARISTNGTLSGLNSLHFAHWSLIDDDTRLLFLTNYDGSWENYLDDFIDKAAIGLTAIWSNTANFPQTSFLVFGGARDERHFKAIARTTQAYTNVWYSAYPSLPVTGIENNSAICEGLSQPASALDIASWLRRF